MVGIDRTADDSQFPDEPGPKLHMSLSIVELMIQAREDPRVYRPSLPVDAQRVKAPLNIDEDVVWFAGYDETSTPNVRHKLVSGVDLDDIGLDEPLLKGKWARNERKIEAEHAKINLEQATDIIFTN